MHTDVNITPSLIYFSLELVVVSYDSVMHMAPGDHRVQDLQTIVCKFGRNPAVCLWEAIFVPAQNGPYHMIFDLDCELDHTLDAH